MPQKTARTEGHPSTHVRRLPRGEYPLSRAAASVKMDSRFATSFSGGASWPPASILRNAHFEVSNGQPAAGARAADSAWHASQHLEPEQQLVLLLVLLWSSGGGTDYEISTNSLRRPYRYSVKTIGGRKMHENSNDSVPKSSFVIRLQGTHDGDTLPA